MLIFLYFFNCLSLFTQQMPFILFIIFFLVNKKCGPLWLYYAHGQGAGICVSAYLGHAGGEPH